MKGVPLMLAKRLGLGLGTLVVVSVIIFGAVELLPGDLAEQILGQAATPETVAAMRKDLGLDRSAPVRYFEWLSDALRGDFGVSLANKRSVSEQIGPRFANTLFLAAMAAAVAVPISIVLGVLAALYRESVFDRVANVATLTSISSPEFFLGYILILFLAVQNPFFPSISAVKEGMPFVERVYVTTLPALTLTLVVIAHMMRMTRAAIIALLAAPYIEMARLKGDAAPGRSSSVHALPNSLGTDYQRGGALNLAYLITGVVLVESGVRLSRGSVSCWSTVWPSSDFPLVQACCLIFADDVHSAEPGRRRGGNPDEPASTLSEVRG